MKNTILLIFGVAGSCGVFGQTHEVVSRQENGVVVVRSKGAEPASAAVFIPNPERTINDWNLPECEDALRHIAEKLQAVPAQDENYERVVAYYKEQQALILERKKALTGK